MRSASLSLDSREFEGRPDSPRAALSRCTLGRCPFRGVRVRLPPSDAGIVAPRAASPCPAGGNVHGARNNGASSLVCSVVRRVGE